MKFYYILAKHFNFELKNTKKIKTLEIRNMSLRNAIKMINIQKCCSIRIGSIQSILSSLVLSGPFCPLKSNSAHSVVFNPLWSNSVHLGHVGPIPSTLVLFSPFCLLWLYLVLFGPFFPLWSTSILFVTFGLLWLYLVHSVHINLVQSICSYSVHLVPFGPMSIWSIQITLVHFDPSRSIFVHLHNKKVHVWVENT